MFNQTLEHIGEIAGGFGGADERNRLPVKGPGDLLQGLRQGQTATEPLPDRGAQQAQVLLLQAQAEQAHRLAGGQAAQSEFVQSLEKWQVFAPGEGGEIRGAGLGSGRAGAGRCGQIVELHRLKLPAGEEAQGLAPAGSIQHRLDQLAGGIAGGVAVAWHLGIFDFRISIFESRANQ